MTPALVVGLLPKQARKVERALGHRYRFKFVESDKAKHIRTTKAMTVVLVDYVDHSVEERLERMLQPDQSLLRIRGLEKNVITQLENHEPLLSDLR